jgi:hypothetical protein
MIATGTLVMSEQERRAEQDRHDRVRQVRAEEAASFFPHLSEHARERLVVESIRCYKGLYMWEDVEECTQELANCDAAMATAFVEHLEALCQKYPLVRKS